MKPEIPVINGGFLIRLPNLNYHIMHINRNNIVSGSNEQRLLALFHNNRFSKADAAEALNISESGAYKLLQRMTKQGLLNAQKSGKQWLYQTRKMQ